MTTSSAPRLSQTMTSMAGIDASERAIADELQAALAPSFVLVRRLGAGGMGIVYLARDPALKRLVAVKVMSPDRASDPETRARFEREAEAVAAISHPNVVAVYSVGELKNGLPYLVMQYVEGPSMAERLHDEGPLDLESAKAIIGQVASALAAAHRKGIIHRDIKAANVLWDDRASRALVTDFGIAAILEREVDGQAINLTQTGVILGTPRYMSPEQLLSEPVTEKTDIYSLGLLGYELLTGEGPYTVTSPNAIVAAHLRDMPRPLSVMRPDADPELESLLKLCLEKDAHGRPNAEDVARRLQHGASILLEWPPPGLEALHGAIGRPLSTLVTGAFGLAIPLTIVASVDRGNVLRPGMPQLLILPSLAAMGGIAVLIATVDCLRLFRDALRAARAGYGWGIIAEVLADTGHDTGALISGEREYAALSAEERNTLRRGRGGRTGLKLLAAVWAVAGFFIGVPVAVRLVGSSGFLAFWTLGIPLALLLGARISLRRELKLLDPIRSRIRKHRQPLDRLSHLAATWRDSFDRLLAGVGLGHGATGRLKRRVATAVGVAAIATVGALGAYSMVMTSVLNEISEGHRVPKMMNVQDRATRVERLRAYRTPIDPSVTPLRAGYAIQSITNAGEPPGSLSLGMVYTPVKFPIAPLVPAGPDVKSPFHGDWVGGKAMRQAAKGLSPEQRAYLVKIAAQPGASEFSTLARAGSIDWISAALVQPLPKGSLFLAVPVPRYSRMKATAYANSARAVLAFADGKPKEAEQFLRENVGAGFAMTEGPTLIENLIGLVIVNIGRSELVALYDLTGRGAESRAISAEVDPAREAVSREADPTEMGHDLRQVYLQGVIQNPGHLRGLRWALVESFLAYQPCGDFRQMLFGPDAVYAERMAAARKALVRTPGEEQMMGLAERALDTPIPMSDIGPVSGGHRVLMAVARAVDVLSGARRVQACTSITPLSGW